jgi:imidazolonepropionase-like amidohydrolase
MKLSSLALAALLFTGAAARASEPRAEVYALTGAKLVTVASAPVEGGTLVIRDGLIEAAGKGIPIPKDARVIDATGLVVTPGFIDALSGAGLPQPPKSGGSGGGNAPKPQNPFAPEAKALDEIKAPDALKLRDSGFTTVLSISRDGIFPGQSVLLDLWGKDLDAMVLRDRAALHLHLTSLRRQYPGSLMGTMAYVRQAFLDAAHAEQEQAAYEASPKGRKRPTFSRATEALEGALTGKEMLVVTAYRTNDIRRALALADEFKPLKIVVAGAEPAYPLADLVKARHLPLLVSVNFDPPHPAGFRDGQDDEKQKRDIEESQKNPGELEKAKVPFALVSGYAEDFLGGVRKAIESGLGRDEAVRALTLRPAEILGISDRTGSLEAGKIANVAVWTGEPLVKETKLKLLFVDGHLYEPEAKDKDAAEGKDGKPKEQGAEEVSR